jgi:FkbM family methyltransferase
MKSFLRNLFRSVIGFGLLLIAYELVVWAHAPAMAWGISAIGRNPNCNAMEGYLGLVGQAAQRAAIDRMAAQTHLMGNAGKLKRYRTPRGEFWIPEGSENVLPRLSAQQEARIYGAIERGDVVIDCGAHVGTFTREALTAGAKLVVAVEPAPNNIECLRRAFGAEIASGRMIVVPKGVWHKEESLPLFADPQNSAADSFVITGSNDRVVDSIPLTTIDRLVEEYKVGKVTLIKMDIKGATLQALEGGRNTIARDHPRIAISTEEEADDPALITSAVLRVGAYRHRCGICSINKTYSLTPDVLLFW